MLCSTFKRERKVEPYQTIIGYYNSIKVKRLHQTNKIDPGGPNL